MGATRAIRWRMLPQNKIKSLLTRRLSIHLATPCIMIRRMCRGGSWRSSEQGFFPPSLSTLSSHVKLCCPLQKKKKIVRYNCQTQVTWGLTCYQAQVKVSQSRLSNPSYLGLDTFDYKMYFNYWIVGLTTTPHPNYLGLAWLPDPSIVLRRDPIQGLGFGFWLGHLVARGKFFLKQSKWRSFS